VVAVYALFGFTHTRFVYRYTFVAPVTTRLRLPLHHVGLLVTRLVTLPHVLRSFTFALRLRFTRLRLLHVYVPRLLHTLFTVGWLRLRLYTLLLIAFTLRLVGFTFRFTGYGLVAGCYGLPRARLRLRCCCSVVALTLRLPRLRLRGCGYVHTTHVYHGCPTFYVCCWLHLHTFRCSPLVGYHTLVRVPGCTVTDLLGYLRFSSTRLVGYRLVLPTHTTFTFVHITPRSLLRLQFAAGYLPVQFTRCFVPTHVTFVTPHRFHTHTTLVAVTVLTVAVRLPRFLRLFYTTGCITLVVGSFTLFPVVYVLHTLLRLHGYILRCWFIYVYTIGFTPHICAGLRFSSRSGYGLRFTLLRWLRTFYGSTHTFYGLRLHTHVAFAVWLFYVFYVRFTFTFTVGYTHTRSRCGCYGYVCYVVPFTLRLLFGLLFTVTVAVVGFVVVVTLVTRFVAFCCYTQFTLRLLVTHTHVCVWLVYALRAVVTHYYHGFYVYVGSRWFTPFGWLRCTVGSRITWFTCRLRLFTFTVTFGFTPFCYVLLAVVLPLHTLRFLFCRVHTTFAGCGCSTRLRLRLLVVAVYGIFATRVRWLVGLLQLLPVWFGSHTLLDSTFGSTFRLR